MISTNPRHQVPRSVDEIDFDQIVWDPIYRESVRHLLKSQEFADEPTPDITPGVDNDKPALH